jgi:hypothetical protein
MAFFCLSNVHNWTKAGIAGAAVSQECRMTRPDAAHPLPHMVSFASTGRRAPHRNEIAPTRSESRIIAIMITEAPATSPRNRDFVISF